MNNENERKCMEMKGWRPGAQKKLQIENPWQNRELLRQASQKDHTYILSLKTCDQETLRVPIV